MNTLEKKNGELIIGVRFLVIGIDDDGDFVFVGETEKCDLFTIKVSQVFRIYYTSTRPG